jgi:hypothetical protein
MTEDEIALEFAKRHCGKLAYVANSTEAMARRWFTKEADGSWRRDNVLLVSWLIRLLCTELREQCEDPVIREKLSCRETFSNVEILARCDPRLVKTKSAIGLSAKSKAKAES